MCIIIQHIPVRGTSAQSPESFCTGGRGDIMTSAQITMLAAMAVYLFGMVGIGIKLSE